MPKFQFKKFTISQNLCAMKVGTDGVLIGAWSNIKKGNVLDIGCGTGLISLMICQREQNILVDAIDIDENAIIQTRENIQNSPWKGKIKAHQVKLQNFNSKKQYNLIITNPPYFTTSTNATNEQRNLARHNSSLTFSEIVLFVCKNLDKDGILTLILPVNEAIIFEKEAIKNHLFLNRKCTVKPNPNKITKRVLMEFSFQKNPLIIENITIETLKRHHYTKDYINLTRDFYLKF